MMVRVFAPAKVNITLEVGRPDADRMHPLQSAVMFADVGDWIEATPNDVMSLTIEGPFAAELSANGDNLVLRAARALDVGRGAALRLMKNLPVASGIGGGSSDAAATLKALNQLWSLGLSESDLQHKGLGLGSDVGACVMARAAWMTGIGEKLEPMAAPVLYAVLVNPRLPLATARVYAAFDAAQLGGAFSLTRAPTWSSLDDVVADARARGNDLTAPAVHILPAIGEIVATLQAEPGVVYAALSGSGATCFALVESADEALRVGKGLSARWPDWWIVPAALGAA